MRIFNIDSPLMRALNYFTDLVILNILWIICCIPIVTIGASTTALYGFFLNRSTESSVVKRFWGQFKSNLKKSTILWMIEVVFLAILVANIWFYYNNIGGDFSILRIVFLIPAVILGVGIEYIFPLQSHFENNVKQTIKNSFLVGMAHFPTSLLILVIQISPIILALVNIYIFFRISPLLLMIGQSAIVNISSLLFKRVFRQYERGDENEDH